MRRVPGIFRAPQGVGLPIGRPCYAGGGQICRCRRDFVPAEHGMPGAAAERARVALCGTSLRGRSLYRIDVRAFHLLGFRRSSLA
ncbi:hypothetical protein VE25_04970 [Devosia geojensis]|uniref:Uncharacterized protein n=1 Tax=Devosia geojensis TaxID=443610 RepID=A0A0F5FVL8_9HYPH|nr:hypothetical protein VE25_04970 [Devosia geojensis]